MFERERSSKIPERKTDTAHACTAWSLLLPDAADGLLTTHEQRALDAHLAGCAACTLELAEARRGAAWLGLLKPHTPEPPADLLASILAATTGAQPTGAMPLGIPGHAQGADPASAGSAAAYPPHWAPSWPQPWATQEDLTGFAAFRSRLAHWLGLDLAFAPALQPRLAMTVAMAFFSICLTLNLLGFSARTLHSDVLHPAAGLQRTVADTSASLVRSFEGIRVVYRVESRVNQWRTASNQSNDGLIPSGR